jgi:hypothetical protein
LWRRLVGVSAVVLAVMAVSTGASAEWTGDELYEDCLRKGRPEYARCQDYIMGIADDGRPTFGLGVFGYTFCAPDHTALAQVTDVVIGYLATHERDVAASPLVAHALAEAFPCHR